jgi:hypothetical protein
MVSTNPDPPLFTLKLLFPREVADPAYVGATASPVFVADPETLPLPLTLPPLIGGNCCAFRTTPLNLDCFYGWSRMVQHAKERKRECENRILMQLSKLVCLCSVVLCSPVSMRTIGSFDAATLEQSFARQSNCSYKSLSKLDTGCSGLCVL